MTLHINNTGSAKVMIWKYMEKYSRLQREYISRSTGGFPSTYVSI